MLIVKQCKLLDHFIIMVLLIISTICYAQEQPKLENNLNHFDINKFNELKKQHYNDFRGTNEFTIQKDKDTTIRYMEDTEYTVITTIKNVYMINRVYYKPTGILKSEDESFNNLTVNTAKYYDEQGHLTEEYKYTSPDWVDRLTKVAKEKLNIDLWSPNKVMMSRVNNKGKDTLTILHNHGIDLNFRDSSSIKHSALLDFDTLKIIEQDN
ncbi:hypothetical protein [Gilliamella sp. wkB112]|uniref:hypothetical protein n=1 Tax=Gilliamella sp. wkB112 TaxID=3120257 RepID=UPI0011474555|nr:hypothetical protein [Gilliamella apicola]